MVRFQGTQILTFVSIKQDLPISAPNKRRRNILQALACLGKIERGAQQISHSSLLAFSEWENPLLLFVKFTCIKILNG